MSITPSNSICSNKDSSVSIARGIGITLMVLGHILTPTGFGNFVYRIIYAFHMPLFFFLSGYCFKTYYLENTRSFFYKRVKSIYLPFVISNIVFLFLHNFFVKYGIYHASIDYYGTIDFLLKIKRFVTQMADCEPIVGPLWFLKTLFWTSLICFGLIKCIKRTYLRYVILIITFLLTLYAGLYLPYFCVGKTEVYASLFFMTGYELRRHKPNFDTIRFIIPLLVSLLLLAAIYWPTSINDVNSMTYIPYFFSSVAGIMLVMCSSIAIDSNRINFLRDVLVKIGDQSLYILVLHLFIFKLVSLFLTKVIGLEGTLDGIVVSNGIVHTWVLYLFVGIALPLVYAKCHRFIAGRLIRK